MKNNNNYFIKEICIEEKTIRTLIKYNLKIILFFFKLF